MNTCLSKAWRYVKVVKDMFDELNIVHNYTLIIGLIKENRLAENCFVGDTNFTIL